jgi:GNAT superfamily N-acetyltransferase
MKIVRALPGDAAALSSVARDAKGHWGYPEDWLRRWDAVLTLTPAYVAAHPTYALVSDGTVLGFLALVLHGRTAQLDHLWVRPSAMGQGLGRRLFEFAEEVARSAGAATLKVESDPHAEKFYVRMGAIRCGEVPAAMDGVERHLVLLEKALAPRPAFAPQDASGGLRISGNQGHSGAGSLQRGRKP